MKLCLHVAVWHCCIEAEQQVRKYVPQSCLFGMGVYVCVCAVFFILWSLLYALISMRLSHSWNYTVNQQSTEDGMVHPVSEGKVKAVWRAQNCCGEKKKRKNFFFFFYPVNTSRTTQSTGALMTAVSNCVDNVWWCDVKILGLAVMPYQSVKMMITWHC